MPTHLLYKLLCATNVQVFDATNSTRERRDLIIKHCLPYCIKVRNTVMFLCITQQCFIGSCFGVRHVQVFFVESLCDDPQIILENIKARITMSCIYHALTCMYTVAGVTCTCMCMYTCKYIHT